MADIFNPEFFLAGRWDWDAFGYTEGLPRNSSIGDVDGMAELNGWQLMIESKHWTGGPYATPPALPWGQRTALESFTKLGINVLVVYGVAGLDQPLWLHDLNTGDTQDLRDLPLRENHDIFKAAIWKRLGYNAKSQRWTHRTILTPARFLVA